MHIDANGEIVIKEKNPSDCLSEKVYDAEKEDQLSALIKELNDQVAAKKLKDLEKLANQIKKLSIALDIEDLKVVAFKIELDVRRGNFQAATEKVNQINHVYAVYKKTV